MGKGEGTGGCRPALAVGDGTNSSAGAERGSREQIIAGVLEMGIPATFEVGGAPRDKRIGLLRGETVDPHDIDVMASGLTYQELLGICRRHGKAQPLEVNGRLVGVRITAGWTPVEGVDIALARTDRAIGDAGGHHDFEVVPMDPPAELQRIPVAERADAVAEFARDALAADALRRDFTCNAIYENLRTGETIDPLGGIADIEAGVIRAISDRTFADDRLRLLRLAARISKDGAWPDPETDRLAREWAPRLAEVNEQGEPAVSGTRIRQEIEKAMDGEHLGDALRYMRDTGMLEAALPELAERVLPSGRRVASIVGFEQRSPFHELTVCEHTIVAVEHARRLGAPKHVLWALLLHDAGKPESAWAYPEDHERYESGRLRFSRSQDPAWLDEPRRDHADVAADMICPRGVQRDGAPGRPDVAQGLAGRLQMDSDTALDCRYLVAHHMFTVDDGFERLSDERAGLAARKFIARHGRRRALDLLTVRRCDRAAKARDMTSRPGWDADLVVFERRVRAELENVPDGETASQQVKGLVVKGGDLAKMGVRGPDIGRVQQQLLAQVINDPSLNRDRPRMLAIAAKAAGVPAPEGARTRGEHAGRKGGDPARRAAAIAARRAQQQPGG